MSLKAPEWEEDQRPWRVPRRLVPNNVPSLIADFNQGYQALKQGFDRELKRVQCHVQCG